MYDERGKARRALVNEEKREGTGAKERNPLGPFGPVSLRFFLWVLSIVFNTQVNTIALPSG